MVAQDGEGCAAIPMNVARALVATTNQARARAGVPPVQPDGGLNQAAHQHACTMGRVGFFDHRDPAGREPLTRAHAAGYTGCRVLENIAQGQHNAQLTFEGWMARPGHRRNVLDPAVDAVGFGATAVVSARGGPRWVMLLGQDC